MGKFVILVTTIVFRDEDDEIGTYSFQTAMCYPADKYEFEDVRLSTGRHYVGIFLNNIEPNREFEDIIAVNTFEVGESVLTSFVKHLTMVN